VDSDLQVRDHLNGLEWLHLVKEALPRQEELKTIEDIKSIEDPELLSRIPVRSNRINEAAEARVMDLLRMKTGNGCCSTTTMARRRR
jgi:hypothetical protein